MFDRSRLPEADFEFVLLSDTHYMLDATEVEFESRRRQTERVAHAVNLIAALGPDFVVHLGDRVQEFPESPDFDRAMTEADRQLGALLGDTYHVAGNHDVGDKPDPTMPTDPVTPDSLEAYHDRYGQSWYSWDHGSYHFVALNSQIMNSALPEATKQKEWLEEDLMVNQDRQTFVFLHLPPFVHRPDEPALGNYDNIDQPAREWLLDVLSRHSVARLFAGHSHFVFRNHVDGTTFQTVPSPAFTRPGFCELFSSCPPPEQGRDDRAKLGFYLVRVRDGDATIHFVRTGGETATESLDETDLLLTRPTSAVADSPLGVSLLHPLSKTTEVPATFPSAVRQPVHDDYPLLGCLEIGANVIRTPVSDFQREPTRRKLESFRRNGGTVIGTVLSDGENGFFEGMDRTPDELEVRFAGDPWPGADAARQIEDLRQSVGVPVGMSTVVPGRSIPGKQHNRPRSGYNSSELDRLDTHLANYDVTIDRVLCFVGDDSDPWEAIREAPRSQTLDRIGVVDWMVSSTNVTERRQVDRVGRAMFAVANRPASRLYLTPLRTLDRTMDSAAGLLDRRGNPTIVSRAVRCLNTVLFGDVRRWHERPTLDRDGVRLLGVTRPERDVWLVLPPDWNTPVEVTRLGKHLPSGPLGVRRTSLLDGKSGSLGRVNDPANYDATTVEGPTLITFEPVRN